jgi:hypothetical protein
MRFYERNLEAADLFHVFKHYGPIPRVCLDLAGDKRRMLSYEHDLRTESHNVSRSSFLKTVQTDDFSETFKSLSSTLLMIPHASRSPLITFASRHILRQRMIDDRPEIFEILTPERATRHNAETFDFELAVLR